MNTTMTLTPFPPLPGTGSIYSGGKRHGRNLLPLIFPVNTPPPNNDTIKNWHVLAHAAVLAAVSTMRIDE
jgi:hypothetical protein